MRPGSYAGMINSLTYTVTVNQFDELDRLTTTHYNYPGSGQDETITDY